MTPVSTSLIKLITLKSFWGYTTNFSDFQQGEEHLSYWGVRNANIDANHKNHKTPLSAHHACTVHVHITPYNSE